MLGPQTISVTVRNALAKLAGYTAVLTAADVLAPRLYGGTLWPVFYTTVILTVIGAIADLVVTPRLGDIPSLFLGYPAMTLIVWAVGAAFWPIAHVTLLDALLLALGLSAIEHVLHRFVLSYLV